MTRDELLKRYAAGERNFHCADLRGADLSGADLRSAYLSGDPDNEELPKIKLLGPVENLGADERGCTLWAFRAEGGLDGKGRWVISAGCRFFESVTDALAHWGSQRYENPKRGRWFVRRIKLLWDE